METKFTKGEWVNIPVSTATGFFNRVLKHNGESICNVTTRDMQRAKANAQLISAAPDLLEALNACINELYLIYSQYGDKQNARDHSVTLVNAEEAIKKAIGNY